MQKLNDKVLVKKLRLRLMQNSHSIKYFISERLPLLKYNTVISQINGFNPISDEVREAIEKYLGE